MPRKACRTSAPAPAVGFSLIEALRSTRGLISVRQAAEWLGCSQKSIYRSIEAGIIPRANIGNLDMIRIDPRAWLRILEHDNPHILPVPNKAA